MNEKPGSVPASTNAVAPEPAGPKPRRTRREASLEMWRKRRESGWKAPERDPARNPLFQRTEEQRAKLFAWMRECPYDDAVQQMLREEGMAGVTRAHLKEFFALEAEGQWEKRNERAATEANALIRMAERSPVKYSDAILTALGQEAFRQISSGQMEPAALEKMTTLFLRARSDDRADQMQELKREKLRHELQGGEEHGLERLAEEVEKHPEVREAFENLRDELARAREEKS